MINKLCHKQVDKYLITKRYKLNCQHIYLKVILTKILGIILTSFDNNLVDRQIMNYFKYMYKIFLRNTNTKSEKYNIST